MNLDPKLLDIIRCPGCRETLSREGEELVCSGCGNAYPVRDDIPVLLLDEARKPA
ncbi:MAG: Trm112 family protein [Nocardioides sp.]|nr:Trm112 family protein [Nocardioides sp.]